MTQTFAESLTDLLQAAHAPDAALDRLQAAVTPTTTGSDVVFAYTIASLVADMRALQDGFVQDIEKAYGVPWWNQSQKIEDGPRRCDPARWGRRWRRHRDHANGGDLVRVKPDFTWHIKVAKLLVAFIYILALASL